MKTEHVNCPLCGKNNSQILFDGVDREHPIKGVFPVQKCCECSMIYLNPRPTYDSLSECYPSEYDSYDFGRGVVGRLQRFLRDRQACKIAEELPKNGYVLEIGCASGDLLAPLRDRGKLRVEGVEISQYAADMAKELNGLEVHVGTLEENSFPDGTFDGVVMRNVLEHLPDPLATLRRIDNLLKEDGKVFISVPNHDGLDRIVFGKYWYAYETPRHLTVPSVDTLTKMLNAAGFNVVNVRHSMVPNSWISSLRFLFEALSGRPYRLKFISFKNPVLQFLALPFGVIQKLVRRSGRIEVMARKST